MRLDHIRLHGLTTFAEPVDIDATALPAGLIALVGENGTGKTTLLEAMAAPVLDRKFVSRGDGQLVDYATRRDAYIDNTYTLEGRGTFRTRVNLDGTKRTTDALLEQIHDGGTVTRINDGKATTFDAAVRKIFPSKALLTATVFAAQNRKGSFLLASKAQRKDLFGELLGLQHFDAWAETAKRIGAHLVTERATVQAVVDRLAADTSDAYQADLDARAQQLTIDLGLNETAAEETGADLDLHTASVRVATERLEAARTAARSVDAATEKHAAAAAQRDAIRARREDVDGVLAREQRAAEARYAATAARVQSELDGLPTEATLTARELAAVSAADARRNAAVADLDARIAKNQGLIDRGADVRAAADTVKKHDAAIATADQAIDEAQRSLDADTDKIRDLERALAATAHVPAELERAREAAALLTAVPCGGAAPYDGCTLLRNAVAARASIDTLEAQLGDRNDQADVIDDLAGNAGDARNELVVARVDLANLKKATDALRPLAAELAYLEAAEQRIADYRAEQTRLAGAARDERQRASNALREAIADRNRRANALAVALSTAQTACETEVAAAQAEHAAAVATIDTDLARVAETLAAIEAELAGADGIRAAVTTAERAVAAAEVRLRDGQERRASLAVERARLLEQNAAHHRELNTLKAKLDERRALMGRLDALEIDHAEWRMLAQALGRDGLPTLEMDAAGPVVSDLCNDLLEAALGSRRFTVELVTQEAKADGKGLKETFELKVTDSDRGNDARDVTDLSGGEQVLLDEALKAAIAVFLNQRNEQPLRTCWRDETTGALDPENAIRYVAMLRRLQELAGFHQIFMVSHNPVVTAMADAQLQIAGGVVTVAYPPFASEAA